MRRGFCHAFQMGGERVIAIGTDSPDITPQLVKEGFTLLDTAERRLVIGPAEDGGYWLIGMNQYTPQIFRDISWGSEQVFRETMEVAVRHGIEVEHLPPRGDIDTISDLLRYEPDGEFGRLTFALSRSMAARVA
ncbi:MAG: hypothetical protein Fur0034_17830 [Desulfuromonadia bacterium]